MLELLNRGASLDVRDEDSSTPLHDAAAGGHYNIVKLLLSKGADVGVFDEDGDSPLHLACNGGHAAVAGLLLEHLGGGEQRATLLATKNALGMTPAELAEDPALVAQMSLDGEEGDAAGPAFKRSKQ